jgi:DNA (cytosine-5)-methyltransferase 1
METDPYRLPSRRGAPLLLPPRKGVPEIEDAAAVRKWVRCIPRPWAIDLFAGAGGLSLGLKRAGFSIVAAADNDPVALETHAANIGGLTFCGNLADPSDFLELLRAGGIGRADLVAGGPPCAPFSRAGLSKIRNLVDLGIRDEYDPRTELWAAFVAAVEELRPSLVLFENVPDFLAWKDGQALLDLMEELGELGYGTDARLLEASKFGVPQHRMRLFVVGVRGRRQVIWPQEKSRLAKLIDAIGDLPVIRPGVFKEERPYRGARTPFQRSMRRDVPTAEKSIVRDHNARSVRKDDAKAFRILKEGRYYKDLPERLRRYRVDIFDDKYKRLHRREPARSITAHIARDGYWYIHPTQTRTLSIREAARVQTFPDNFRFAGHPSVQLRQIGNAVPPHLAEAIGKSLKKTLASAEGANGVVRFRERLLEWHRSNRRNFPWRKTKDPWTILVAEMALRRTRAEQVADRFDELMSVARTPRHLIRNKGRFRKVASHLGLEWRAKGMVELARVLVKQHKGKVPTSDVQLRALPGVGDYAASALASFAFGRATTIVDTNIERIVSRVTGRKGLHRWQTRLELYKLAGPRGVDARLNYALLDLGAKVCTAKDPQCTACPLAKLCATGGSGKKG